MKREEVIGIKLECVGADKGCENQFTIGKIYEVMDTGLSLPRIIAEDGFGWAVYHNEYTDVNMMVCKLNQNTHGKFKLYKKENIKMEKKMKKEDLEGKFVKCQKGNCHYKTGDILQIKNGEIKSLNGSDLLFSWYNELPSEFTIKELNKLLNKYHGLGLQYIGDLPTPQPKKVKTNEIKVKIKADVDMHFSKLVIEESKEEVFIFSGRNVIYMNLELGCYGIATCNSDELKSYSKEVGKALAYYRAFNSISNEGK